MKTIITHDDAVVSMLKQNPSFATEYLRVAIAESDEPEGYGALLKALRHVSEAQGMADVAKRAGIPRESLYRALSPKGNPTAKTLFAVLRGAGIKLDVYQGAAKAKPTSKLKPIAASRSRASKLAA